MSPSYLYLKKMDAFQNQFQNTSKQGRPPQESEKVPYAVVDERCKETTQFHAFWDLQERHFYLIFCTQV